MQIVSKENELSVTDYIDLRASTGWETLPAHQVKAGLARSLYTVSAMDGGKTIGMGRLVGDGAIIWYAQDVIVLPAYQGMGVGRNIMHRLIEHAELHGLCGSRVIVALMAAIGKEGFYQRLGFRSRPNEKEGAGMMMNLTIPPAAERMEPAQSA